MKKKNEKISRRRLFILILSASAILSLIVLASCAAATTTPEPTFSLTYKSENEDMGIIEGESEQTLKAGETAKSVKAVPNLNYRFVSWSDGSKDAVREGDTIDADTTISATFEYCGFPEMHISFKEGRINHDTYIETSVSLDNASEEIAFDEVGAKLRGRGNGTWSYPKQGYKLKFDQKINLLGLGKKAHRDWVLIPNYVDQSMLRDMFAFSLGCALDGIEIGYNSAYVQLYINDEYRGAYLITEQVEVNSGRVDIVDQGEDVDIGYLLELDNYAGEEKDDVWFKADGLPFNIKSDIHNDAQFDYIKDYMGRVGSAIRSGVEEDIRALVDMPSCVDMYILQEFTKNTDVGWSSFYLYKRSGNDHLFFGPAWDIDLSAGNDDRIDGGALEGLYTGKYVSSAYFQMNEWYIELMSNEWFRAVVLERWNAVKEIITAEINKIEAYGRENTAMFERNFERWDIISQNRKVNQEPWAISVLSTYDEHLDYLVNWYRQRLLWLDNYYNNEMADDETLYGMPDYDDPHWWEIFYGFTF